MEVLDACAAPGRAPGWIPREIKAAYPRLHDLGCVNSVEAGRDGFEIGHLMGRRNS